MMRIALFMATNLGVMLVAGIVMRIFGIDQMVGGGMAASLIYCALFGFVGSFISLIMSKGCLLYTSPSPRDLSTSRMPSSA